MSLPVVLNSIASAHLQLPLQTDCVRSSSLLHPLSYDDMLTFLPPTKRNHPLHNGGTHGVCIRLSAPLSLITCLCPPMQLCQGPPLHLIQTRLVQHRIHLLFRPRHRFRHAYPQLHLKQPQFLTLSLTPLLNMSMSMFTIIGFFMLKDGNRRNDCGHTCYITAISTLKSPNIPAELYAFSAAGDTFFPNHTIVFAIGKAFYPPPPPPPPPGGSEACHH
jgi:hypothetical protein